MIQPVDVRRTIVEIVYRSKASHLGSSLSAVEMLIAMYSSVDLDLIHRKANDRSRIIVSKGHCAAATYSVMHHFGLISKEVLYTYHSDHSLLTGHVSHAVDYVEHSTGGLGHGLPVACGCALGMRARKYPDRPIFVLLGDGELQEGANWEALLLARHHYLYNLIVLIDNNAISSITATRNVIDMNPLHNRIEGFGFDAYDVDGHNLNELLEVISRIQSARRPSVMICNTVKGRGVPFAENQPIWHYRSLNEELYQQALNALQ